MTLSSSMTRPLKKRKGDRRHTLLSKNGVPPPRQVSPFPPGVATNKKSKHDHTATTPINKKSLLLNNSNSSLLLSSLPPHDSSSSNDTTSHKDVRGRISTTTRPSMSLAHSSDQHYATIQTQAPPRDRRLKQQRGRSKQANQWKFRVGEYADERSHGIQNKSTARTCSWSMHDFDVLQEIGSGCFGSVSMAIDERDKRIVALKQVITKNVQENGSVANLRNEVEIQTSLKHEFILQSFGYFLSRDRITLVLEYAPHGNLLELMDKNGGKLSPNLARGYIRQVTSALAHLHSHHVVHRDVKSDNVVLTDNESTVTAKLCDFGYAVHAPPNQNVRTTLCGTPDFVPPEMVVNDASEREYVAAFVDPWSLGVLAWELVMGKPTFHVPLNEKKRIAAEMGYAKPYQVTLDRIKRFTILERPSDDCNEEWFYFCSSLMQKIPHHRMSAAGAMEHAWLCDDRDDASEDPSSGRCK